MDPRLPDYDLRLLVQGDALSSRFDMATALVGTVSAQLERQRPTSPEALPGLRSFFYLPVAALVRLVGREYESLIATCQQRVEGDHSLSLTNDKEAVLREALHIPIWDQAYRQYRAAVHILIARSQQLTSTWSELRRRLDGLDHHGERLRYMAENEGAVPGALTLMMSRLQPYFREETPVWEAERMAREFLPSIPTMLWYETANDWNRRDTMDGATYRREVTNAWTVMVRDGMTLPPSTEGTDPFPWDVNGPEGTVTCDDLASCRDVVARYWNGDRALEPAHVTRLLRQAARDLFHNPAMATMTIGGLQGTVEFDGENVCCVVEALLEFRFPDETISSLAGRGVLFPASGHAILLFAPPQPPPVAAEADPTPALVPFLEPRKGLMGALQKLSRDYGDLEQQLSALARDLKRDAMEDRELLDQVDAVARRAAELEAAWQRLDAELEDWFDRFPPAEFSRQELELAAQLALKTVDQTRERLHQYSAAYFDQRKAVVGQRQKAAAAQEMLSAAHAEYWRKSLARRLATGDMSDWVLVGEPTPPDVTHLGVMYGQSGDRAPKDAGTVDDWKQAASFPFLRMDGARTPKDLERQFRDAVRAAWAIHIGTTIFKGRHSETLDDRCQRLERHTNAEFKQFCASLVVEHVVPLLTTRYSTEQVGFAEVPKCRHYWSDDVALQALTFFRFHSKDHAEELGFVVVYASKTGGRLVIRCSPLHERLPLATPTWEDFDEATRSAPAAAAADLGGKAEADD